MERGRTWRGEEGEQEEEEDKEEESRRVGRQSKGQEREKTE